jgi:uncharacterized protein (DUF433 family)
MKPMTFTQTTPLVQDDDGTIRVTGSRVTLDTLVGAFLMGATAEQIQDRFPSLLLRDIYGVIAFYLEHQSEVEDYLRTRRTEAEAIRREIALWFSPESAPDAVQRDRQNTTSGVAPRRKRESPRDRKPPRHRWVSRSRSCPPIATRQTVTKRCRHVATLD